MNEMILGAIFIIMSIVLLLVTIYLNKTNTDILDDMTGANTVSAMITILLFVCGLLFILRS